MSDLTLLPRRATPSLRTSTRLGAAVVGVCCALDACTGGGSHAAIPRAPQRARASVTFTMYWPSATPGAHRRRPLFISPSAKSVVVEVNSAAAPAGPVTFANAPATSGSPPTTTIAIDAPAGPDDFSIALFDQPQTPGETVPVGTQLGRAELTQTINPGVTNVLNAIVSGIVGGVQIAPAANQPFVETLSATPPQAYALAGDQPETFVVTAVDPDGNVIVPADPSPAHVDTPVVSLAASPATTELAVTPVATDPSRFVVSVLTQKNAPASALALLGSASDGAGDHAQTNIAIDERSALYVDFGGATPGIAAFDDSGTRIALSPSAFGGLSAPGAIAYDTDDHRVFVADAGKIVAFDAAGSPAGGYTPPSLSGVNGIAYDPSDKLLYVSTPGMVSVFTVNGATPSSGPATFPAANANAIAFDPTTPALLLVANASATAPSFDTYAENGTPQASFPIGAPGAPLAVTTDVVSGSIFLTDGVTIRAFTSPTTSTSAADPNGPVALAFDSNLGELYALDAATGALAAYSVDLSTTDAAHGFSVLSSGLSSPKGVAVAF